MKFCSLKIYNPTIWRDDYTLHDVSKIIEMPKTRGFVSARILKYLEVEKLVITTSGVSNIEASKELRHVIL